ncbi:hypothetical protein [Vibrio porteresiae]|uniref:Uncharacterized protein n=1 Tax=Vibrio porteresiae DSM 19223 TaxID=1123496 RepID=A0ABZ0Q933_9VIBR|nr:hypothetical protein [Vibrio porteresiae]WPC72957.1 hypothetical protein R8Z52_12565 [Vibrio porteresiae DSM 19223]
MWVLILTVIFGPEHSDDKQKLEIENFQEKQSCISGGERFIKNNNSELVVISYQCKKKAGFDHE